MSIVPGLSAMTKAQMATLITSVWGLLNEEHVPTHHGPHKRDAYSLYGRVYRALVEGECDGPRGRNAPLERSARSIRSEGLLSVPNRKEKSNEAVK